MIEEMTRAPEIKALILEWYRRLASGEMVAAAEDVLSREQGFVAIGTDPAEWFGDRADLIGAYSETAKPGPPEIIVRQIEAYREGTVGLAADTVILKRPGKSKIPMRHTFVLHQEGGEWQVVHAHCSFPVPEESTAPAEA
jgi:ketosteroid isomerase-like protein